MKPCSPKPLRTNIVAVIMALASPALLSACSMTLPVRGISQESDEVFKGVATGHMDGAGEIKIVSSKGATCEGTFVYVNDRQGEGVFLCSDGRNGPFRFVSTGSRGTGTGVLGGKSFTFTFG